MCGGYRGCCSNEAPRKILDLRGKFGKPEKAAEEVVLTDSGNVDSLKDVIATKSGEVNDIITGE